MRCAKLVPCYAGKGFLVRFISSGVDKTQFKKLDVELRAAQSVRTINP